MQSLFGDEFNIDFNKPKAKELASKARVTAGSEEYDPMKILKSKKVSLEDQLLVIKEQVIRVLGKQRKNIVVIRSLNDFSDYITACIESGYISVDTETNNSLDPVTCKLMGLCLYYPGGKQAYIPVNHKDPKTKEKLSNQITEKQIKEQLQRVKDAKTFVVMHNAKFDFSVIKCTCNIELLADWDTSIAAALIDENEEKGLKKQYILHIDPSQQKYSIEGLFAHIPYAYVDPEIFALYAATDSLMTFRLFKEYQEPILLAEDNKKVKWVFDNIEMPLVEVTAKMELKGVCVDQALGKRLEDKYNAKLAIVDKNIAEELDKLQDRIVKWKLTKDANDVTKRYVPKKSKLSKEALEKRYPLVDNDGKRYAVGKSKASQLTDPINLASPVQMAILFYDILKAPIVNKKSPRGTGEEEIKAIDEKMNIPLCKLLLKRRGLVKILTTYITTIPTLVEHWPDKRIRFHLDQTGTATGRYSSGGKLKFMDETTDEPIEVSGINIQNIPSHEKSIRQLFIADCKYDTVEAENNEISIPEYTEIETVNGYKYPIDLTDADIIVGEDTNTNYKINKILLDNKIYYINLTPFNSN